MATFDKINITNVKNYWATKEANRIPYLGETLFPADVKLGIKLEFIKGYNNAPVALMPAAFDESVQLRDKSDASIETTQMPFFREGVRLGEQDRQELLMFEETQPMYAEAIARRVMDDNAGLIESALVNAEIMRMGLLQNGKFKIASVGANGKEATYEVDYGATKWAKTNVVTLTGTAKWSDEANADVIKDITDMVVNAQGEGVELTRAICGVKTWRHILNNAKIKQAIQYSGIVTPEQVKAYIYNVTGVQVLVYNKQYKGLDGMKHFFFEQEGAFVMLPDGDLGKTWYGSAPHAVDAMQGVAGDTDVEVVANGVCIFAKHETAPVNLLFGVEEIVCPSFEAMDSVYKIAY